MKGSRGLGQTGERLALEYLRDRGFELVEANWRCPNGELDLIMGHGGTIVFVEVRTRRGEDHGTPEESVTAAKRSRLLTLAELWLSERYPDSEPPDCRIDVVGVHLSPQGRLLKINHVIAIDG